MESSMDHKKQNTNYLYYNMGNNEDNHLETAIMAIEAEIAKARLKISNLERVRDKMYSLLDEPSKGQPIIQQPKAQENPISEEPQIVPVTKQNSIEKEALDFTDYPHKEHFRTKMNYLDMKVPRAFKMRDRIDLIEKIEGVEARKELEKKISSKLNYLLVTGFYIGAKYNNDNKLLFYFKPAWLIPEGSDYKIKPEFQPSDKDFDFLPAYLRNEENITWIPEKKQIINK